MSKKKKDIEKILKKYEPLMHNLLRKYKIKYHYKDYLQELRIKTWEVFKKYKNTENTKFMTFLYPCLRNKIISLIILEGRFYCKDGTLKSTGLFKARHPFSFCEEFAEKLDNQSSKIRKKVLIKLLLENLSEKEKTLLYYIYFDGLSHKEVAELYGVTRNAITRRVFRVIQKLREFAKKQ